MGEAGTEILEKPISSQRSEGFKQPSEKQAEVKPYSEQEVVYYYGGQRERAKRSEVVRHHLEWIHPTLAKWADRFGPGKDQIKDISHPDYFDPEYSRGTPDTLEPKDLVLIHLTNTFPEGGTIRPTGYYRPEVLRFSLHFAVNGPVVEEAQYGVGNWERRRYAILIPFEKVMDRIEQFSPGDTIIMDELELPEGSLILAGNVAHLPKDTKKAGEAEIAIENFGKTGQDLRLATYRAILSKGYCPLEQGSHENWINWFPDYGVLNAFTAKHNIRYGTGHWYHWSHDLERISGKFLWAEEDNDPVITKEAISDAIGFIERKSDLPEKYKEALQDLIDKHERDPRYQNWLKEHIRKQTELSMKWST